MAGTGNDELKIVKRYHVHGAPTGESERYVTEDGRVWQKTYTHERQTGVIPGRRTGNTIKKYY